MSATARDELAGLLTYEQAADELGITVFALRKAISNKRMEGIKVRGMLNKFVRRTDVENYKATRYSGMGKRPASSQAPSPESQPERSAAGLTSDEINARTAAASAPLLEGWKETRRSLATIAIASLMLASGDGLNIDPKALAGQRKNYTRY